MGSKTWNSNWASSWRSRMCCHLKNGRDRRRVTCRQIHLIFLIYLIYETILKILVFLLFNFPELDNFIFLLLITIHENFHKMLIFLNFFIFKYLFSNHLLFKSFHHIFLPACNLFFDNFINHLCLFLPILYISSLNSFSFWQTLLQLVVYFLHCFNTHWLPLLAIIPLVLPSFHLSFISLLNFCC